MRRRRLRETAVAFRAHNARLRRAVESGGDRRQKRRRKRLGRNEAAEAEIDCGGVQSKERTAAESGRERRRAAESGKGGRERRRNVEPSRCGRLAQETEAAEKAAEKAAAEEKGWGEMRRRRLRVTAEAFRAKREQQRGAAETVGRKGGGTGKRLGRNEAAEAEIDCRGV